MSQYPTINYIGSKQKIVDWIVNNMPLKKGVVLDLFAGGCSVSYGLKQKGYTVLCNDYLYSNYVLAKAIIENNKTVLKTNFNNIVISEKEIEQTYRSLKPFLENIIYHDFEVKELARLVNVSEKLDNYEKYIFLSLLRRSMIRKIPYSRMNVKWEEILKFRDEEYSYKKYGRYRSYHNKPFIYHINDSLDEYNNSVFDSKKEHKAYNEDCFDLANNIEKVDIIYLDPPYPSTMNNYESFYGRFDLMFGKKPCAKSTFSNKQTFLKDFEILIQLYKNKTKYFVISLNNKCKPSSENICEMLNKYCESIEIIKKPYVYRVTGKENKNTNEEILIIGKTI